MRLWLWLWLVACGCGCGCVANSLVHSFSASQPVGACRYEIFLQVVCLAVIVQWLSFVFHNLRSEFDVNSPVCVAIVCSRAVACCAVLTGASVLWRQLPGHVLFRQRVRGTKRGVGFAGCWLIVRVRVFVRVRVCSYSDAFSMAGFLAMCLFLKGFRCDTLAAVWNVDVAWLYVLRRLIVWWL